MYQFSRLSARLDLDLHLFLILNAKANKKC
jgi:hypothetical protein